MRTVLIIPALDEESVIGRVVAALPRDLVDQVVVVDNGSTDTTAAVAQEAGARVVREPFRGYGAACMAGVAAEPDADVYVFLDGDGSDPPQRLPEMLQALEKCESDLVLGVRRGDVEPGSMLWHQRLGNLYMSWLIRWLSSAPVHDLASFKAIRGDVLRSLDLKDRRHGWTAELITRCACRGLRIVEVETGYKVRVGQSKVSGSVKGSLLAAYRLNAAIVRVWWQERRTQRRALPMRTR